MEKKIGKIIILCGIPLAGKSTWAKKHNLPVISCDIIRERMYGKDYTFHPYLEQNIWDEFYRQVERQKEDCIIDNTNCRYSYISKIALIGMLNGHDIEIVYFTIPLWKAYYRNIKRYLQTGKWIPLNVIKNMKKNFDKLNKQQINEYLLHK